MTTVKLKVDLEGEVISAFADLLGRELSTIVVNSAKMFDNPRLYPLEFLNACKKAFGDLIGSDVAEEKLKPIYAKLKKS